MRTLIAVLLLVSTTVQAEERDWIFLGFVATGVAVTQIKRPDEQTHFGVGLAFNSMCTAITKHEWWCLGGTALLAAGKEAYDRGKENHKAEWADFGYTMAGGAIAGFLTHRLNKQQSIKPMFSYNSKPAIGLQYELRF